MQIDDHFDSGNIEVLDAGDPANIQLTLRADPPCETPDGTVRYEQWFHFRVTGVRGVPLTIRLVGAAETSYPGGWVAYRAVYSTDHHHWRRADTTYDERVALDMQYITEWSVWLDIKILLRTIPAVLKGDGAY